MCPDVGGSRRAGDLDEDGILATGTSIWWRASTDHVAPNLLDGEVRVFSGNGDATFA